MTSVPSYIGSAIYSSQKLSTVQPFDRTLSFCILQLQNLRICFDKESDYALRFAVLARDMQRSIS